MAATTGKPTFFWQAVLTTAPVLVLLLVGLSSLRQDRLLAQREVAEQGQRLGDELLSASAAALAAPGELREAAVPLMELDARGQLLFPPPIARLTPQPLLDEALTSEQASAWRRARKLEAQGSDPAVASAAYARFLSLQPPAVFAANATYALGLLEAVRGDTAAAVAQFTRLVEGGSGAATDSGLPLWPLAGWKLLQLQTNLPPAHQLQQVQAFCSNVVYSPTPVSAALLGEAARTTSAPAAAAVLQQWTQLWHQHEQGRAFYEAAKGDFTNAAGAHSAAFWFRFGRLENSRGAKGTTSGRDDQTEPWYLCVRCPEKPGIWFRCWPEREVEVELDRVFQRIASHQDYLGLELRVAGRTLVRPEQGTGTGGPSEGEHAAELLVVDRGVGNGAAWLEASVYLTRPAWLYAHQRTRRWWFGALLACSGAAAAVGLVSSWRAFQRQQRLSELKSNFVSSVSHELRTPIASVQLLVEGLESGRVSSRWKQQEYLRLIRQECRRLASLIENILDFSRIEQGRKEFQFEPTDPIMVVEQAVKVIEPYAVEKKVLLSVRIPQREAWAERPLPWLDRGSLTQALLNLVDNAIKHSPESQTVTIGLERADGATQPAGGQAPQATLRLWVEDQGAGIPVEEQEKIFERFYRRGSELRRETQGVGIGLSIVKHVVEGHGGRVLVRSALGQGSRFTVELPIHAQPPDVSHES